MKAFRIALFAAVCGASFAASGSANAAPRLLFKGCAYWSMLPPFCLKMKATDGRTYELQGAGPAFTPGYPVTVYANPGPEWGLCFAPIAKVVNWKPNPAGKC